MKANEIRKQIIKLQEELHKVQSKCTCKDGIICERCKDVWRKEGWKV